MAKVVNSHRRSIGGVVWIIYLLLVPATSFLQGNTFGSAWYVAAAMIYVLASAQLLLVAHSRVVWSGRGWHSSISVMVVLGLSLVWLFLQLVIPYENAATKLLIDGSTPVWFNPNPMWTVVPGQTLELFQIELLMVVSFALTVSLVATRRRLKQLLAVLVLVLLSHALIGIAAKYFNFYLVELKQLDGHFSVARGWFVNRNHFASFLVLSSVSCLALIVHWWLRSTQKSAPIKLLSFRNLPYQLSILGLPVLLVGLLLSQSRAALLGFCVSLSLTVLAVKTTRELVFASRGALVAILLAIAIVFVGFGDEFSQRLLSGGLSLGERAEQWRATLSIIKSEWFFGYGGNSYATVFQLFREHDSLRQVIYNQSHNEFLHLWMEQGIVGLLLWLSVLGLVFRHLIRSMRTTSSSLVRGVLIACTCVLSAAILQSFVDFNLQIINIRFYFFVIMGIAFAAPAVKYRRPTQAMKSNALEKK